MNELDSIINSLSAKHHSSLTIDEPVKPKPRYQPEEREAPRVYTTGSYSSATPPKVFPSERMGYINSSSNQPLPKRQPFNMFIFSDSDLDWMLNTPVKREWSFETWLEVIGWPSDLHPKHDGASYAYAAKAFIRLKQAAHRK